MVAKKRDPMEAVAFDPLEKWPPTNKGALLYYAVLTKLVSVSTVCEGKRRVFVHIT